MICADCGEDNNIVYYLDGSWICWDCILKAYGIIQATDDNYLFEECIDFNDKIGNSKFDDVMEFDLTARDAFAELWDSTVKEDWQKFASSPLVWVIEFERCERPEGWWEYRHFNPDDVYNCLVDEEVLAWMPLPDSYKESVMK